MFNLGIFAGHNGKYDHIPTSESSSLSSSLYALDKDDNEGRQPGTEPGYRPSEHSKAKLLGVRTQYSQHSISLLGWPTLGGVIELPRATGVDFEFLGLDIMNPPQGRDDDQGEEEEFCRKLLSLGAKWWDSIERRAFVHALYEMNASAVDDIDEDLSPVPTARERRRVCVGYAEGGFWLLDYDTRVYGVEPGEEECPVEMARLTLARSMSERCAMLERMGTRFYESVDDLDEDGKTFLGAWAWKEGGEAGELVQYPHNDGRNRLDDVRRPVTVRAISNLRTSST